MDGNTADFGRSETDINSIKSEMKSNYRRLSLAVLTALVSAFAVQIAVETAVMFFYPDLSENSVFLFLLSTLSIYFVGVPLAFLVSRRAVKDVPLVKSTMKPGALLGFFTVGVTLMMAGNVLGSSIDSFINTVSGKPVNDDLTELLSGMPVWLSVISLTVLAPIMEELLFRKLLIDGTSKYGSVTSIFFSALCFGLFHGNIGQFFYAFFLGLLLGYVYYKTRRLIYTVILHSAVNLLCGVFPLLVIGNASRLEELLSAEMNIESAKELLIAALPLAVYGLLITVSVIGGIAVLAANIKKITLEPCALPLSGKEKRRAAFLNICIIPVYIVALAVIIIQYI